ncbi:MAG: DUF2917 domain-containing protein [Alphaproteobacteria bacterium]|nr:MAG: DUF2917 domain-containing protein [Alphaproteobacteria bacterium]
MQERGQTEASMSNRLGADTLHLKPRELLDIHDGEGLLVTCVDGVLWITQSNDTDDIVLESGESFVLDRPGLAIVSAPIGPADLIVQPQSHSVQERACVRSNAA